MYFLKLLSRMNDFSFLFLFFILDCFFYNTVFFMLYWELGWLSLLTSLNPWGSVFWSVIIKLWALWLLFSIAKDFLVSFPLFWFPRLMLGNFSYGSIDTSFSSSLVIETMSRDLSGFSNEFSWDFLDFNFDASYLLNCAFSSSTKEPLL